MNIVISTPGIIDYTLQAMTAIGTLGAVLLSLWLSIRRNKVNASGFINFSISANEQTKSTQEHLMIEIINNGIKPFRIVNFSIRSSLLNLNFVFFPDPAEKHSTSESYVYEESSSGFYIYPKESLNEVLKKDLFNIKNSSLKKNIKSLSFYAKTNTGHEILLKPKNNFTSQLIEKFSEG